MREIRFKHAPLEQHRRQLIDAELIAYDAPLYQVLAFPTHQGPQGHPDREQALAQLARIRRGMR